MKKILILGTGLLAFTLYSCNFLDRSMQDAIDKDNYFATANQQALEQYCNDLYPKLIKGHGDPQTYNFGMMEEDFKSDDIFPWDYNKISFGHQTAPTETKDTEWQWVNIRACNDFLDNYMKSSESLAIKQRYAGEILFFKCLDYFNKLRTYGNVPWYYHALTTDSEDLYKGRDSRKLVVDSIILNIDKAIAWLPQKTQVYRISKDAAIALKARICLFEGTYRRYHDTGIGGDAELLKLAYDAAGTLMKAPFEYSLFKGSSPAEAYHELFIQSNYGNNPEVILSKEYEPAVGKGNNLTRQIAVGEVPIGMSKSCADYYLCTITGKPISLCGCTGHTSHTTFIAELQNRDPRMLQTIATPDPADADHTYYLQGRPPMIAKVITSSNDSKKYGSSSTGYAIAKYYNPLEYTTAHHQGTLDAPIFRYAEILLIRAEAGAELGLDPELNKTINELRARVGFTQKLTANPLEDPQLKIDYPTIKGADANLIREIRRERRIEMFGEGARYSDLMRWGCGKLLEAKKEGFIPDPTLYNESEMNIFTTGKVEIIKEGKPTEYIDAGIQLFSNGTLDLYGQRVKSPAVFNDPQHYLFAIPLNELSLNPNLRPNNPGW